MQYGLIAIIDALGYKEHAKSYENPLELLEHLKFFKESAFKIFHEENGKSQLTFRVMVEEQLPLKILFLSDTIVIGLAVTSEPKSTKNLGMRIRWSLWILSNILSRILSISPKHALPLAYRGCIVCGRFAIEEEFIIGPAVDEAISLYEQPDAAIIIAAPSLLEYLEEDDGNEGSDIIRSGDVQFVRYLVPLKDGKRFDTYALNVLSSKRIGIPKDAYISQTLKTFKQNIPTMSVLIKKQNTHEFLKHCMKNCIDQ